MKAFGKIAAIMLAAVMATVIFTAAGCGGATVGVRGDNAKDDVLTVGIAGDSGESVIIETLRRPFEKMYKEKTGKTITVSSTRINGEYINGIQTRKNANNLPNIVQVYDYAAEFLTYREVLEPISGFMERDGVSDTDFVPSVVSFMKSGGTNDDKVYWAARDYNRVVVMYNKDIFDAAGVSYPQNGWTWDEFTAACKNLSDASETIKAATNRSVFYPVDANLNFEAVYYPAIRSFGGDIYDTAAGSAFKNEQGVKRGLTELYNLVDKGYSLAPGQSGTAFSVKEAAMYFCVRPNIVSAATHLRKPDGTSPIDFVTMPTFTDNEKSYVGMGCTGYGITVSCPENKRELAWEFLKFVMSEEGQTLLSSSGSGFPMRKDMLNEEAAFNDFLPEADHSAFYTDPSGSKNADVAMNFLKGFRVQKHNAIYSVIKDNLMTSLCNQNNSDSYYNTLKSRFNGAIA